MSATDQTPAFWYIAANGDNLLKLQQTLRAGADFNPIDFGMLLEYGSGYDPPPEVQTKMWNEYGFNHEKALPIITTDNASASA